MKLIHVFFFCLFLWLNLRLFPNTAQVDRHSQQCPWDPPAVIVTRLPCWEVFQIGVIAEGALWHCVEIFWVTILVQTMSALLWPDCLWWRCLWPSLSFLWPKSSWASFWHYILMHMQQIRRSPKTPSAASSGLSSCHWGDAGVWGHAQCFCIIFIFF